MLRKKKIRKKVKKSYLKPFVSCLDAEIESGFLAASLTEVPITVDKVSVEDYTAGFNEGGNDFKEISFD